ncbi:MAG TPA: hypothetical protein VM238_03095 [Phycisphaerae bacterium]|nr:hypothetical protein [Phycisphaerae bacterium]
MTATATMTEGRVEWAGVTLPEVATGGLRFKPIRVRPGDEDFGRERARQAVQVMRGVSMDFVLQPAGQLCSGMIVMGYSDPMTNRRPSGWVHLIRKLISYSPRQVGWLCRRLDGSGETVEKWFCQ